MFGTDHFCTVFGKVCYWFLNFHGFFFSQLYVFQEIMFTKQWNGISTAVLTSRLSWAQVSALNIQKVRQKHCRWCHFVCFRDATFVWTLNKQINEEKYLQIYKKLTSTNYRGILMKTNYFYFSKSIFYTEFLTYVKGNYVGTLDWK